MTINQLVSLQESVINTFEPKLATIIWNNLYELATKDYKPLSFTESQEFIAKWVTIVKPEYLAD